MRTALWVCIGVVLSLFALPLLTNPSSPMVDLGVGLLFVGVGIIGGALGRGGGLLRFPFRSN